MFIFIVIIIAIIIYASKSVSSTTENTSKNNSYTKPQENSYKPRTHIYQNAIEQNRYHSISKLSYDYHIPSNIVMRDLKQMQQDGYFANIKVEYSHDEIVYFDESSHVRQETAKAENIQKQQSTQGAQTAAYAKLHRNTQTAKPVVNEVDSASQTADQAVTPRKQTKPAPKKEKKTAPVTQSQVEDLPAYQANYGDGKTEYNFVAEYPDLTHIWDDINPDIIPSQKGTIICPKCKTENIIVRDTNGRCNCYYCQEALM